MNTLKLNCENKPLMVAHRGCSGLERENTNSAFVAAGNRTYWGIETDVHVTADGRFIVIHDDNTARVAVDKLVVDTIYQDVVRNIEHPPEKYVPRFYQWSTGLFWTIVAAVVIYFILKIVIRVYFRK